MKQTLIRKRTLPVRWAGAAKSAVAIVALTGLGVALTPAPQQARAEIAPAAALRQERSFTFTYNVEVGPLEEGKPADIFIPLAKSNQQQSVARTIVSSVVGKEAIEPEYGNEFYHIHVPAGTAEKVTASVKYDVTRKLHSRCRAPARETG